MTRDKAHNKVQVWCHQELATLRIQHAQPRNSKCHKGTARTGEPQDGEYWLSHMSQGNGTYHKQQTVIQIHINSYFLWVLTHFNCKINRNTISSKLESWLLCNCVQKIVQRYLKMHRIVTVSLLYYFQNKYTKCIDNPKVPSTR